MEKLLNKYAINAKSIRGSKRNLKELKLHVKPLGHNIIILYIWKNKMEIINFSFSMLIVITVTENNNKNLIKLQLLLLLLIKIYKKKLY